MKNFNVSKKIVAIFLAAAMATLFFAGCEEGNNERSKVESTVESFEENSIDESENSIDVKLVESNPIVSAESSEEANVVDEGSTVSEESIEESVVESEVESLVEESSEEESSEGINAAYTVKDIIAYGKALEMIQPMKNGELLNAMLPQNLNFCILKVNEDSYDVYVYGDALTVDSSKVELYPDSFIPDFSEGIPWYGLSDEDIKILKSS